MDGWLCGDCRSLNTPRAKACYRCNVPRRFGEAPADLESTTIVRANTPGSPAGGMPARLAPLQEPRPGVLPPGASKARDARGRPTVADARSSRRRSAILVVLLGLSTAWAALLLAMMLARGGSLGLLMDVFTFNQGVLSTLVMVSLGGSLLTLVTAVAWFTWFDRVLRNVPALTGEWPDSGRVGAFGWWLVPVVGLVKAPRIVGDVYFRLAVEGTPGLWLLGLWVVTWIGGTVAPWAAERVLSFAPLPLDVLLALSDLISLLSQLSYITAGVCAVALVLSIEHAQRVRMELGGAAAPRPSGTTAADERFQAALAAAAQVNAAAKVADRGLATGSSHPLEASPAGARGGSMLSLSPTIRPAAGGGEVAADGEPVLRPVPHPPTPAPVSGVTGSKGVVATASGSPIPGAHADGLFTGLPEAASGGRRGLRRPGGVAVPRLAMVLVIVAVVVATLAGVMLAGPRGSTPGSVDDIVNEVLTDGLPTPGPTLPRPSLDAPTPRPTPVPTRSPEPWIAAAEHLASSTFAQDWTGRMAIDAELRIGDKDPLAWTLSVARAGTTEWHKRRIVVPVVGPLVEENVVLARTVWTRENNGEWTRRDRGFGDQPTAPLFGVPDARGLTYLRTFKEGGEVRFEFQLDGANDLLALEYLRDVGVGSLDRTGATVVTDAAGDPVHAELSYAGPAKGGRGRLTVLVTWKDVGGTFTIGSPKDGPIVVD